MQDRQDAKKLFATENGNDQPAQAPSLPPSKTFVPGDFLSDDSPETLPVEVEEPSRRGPTPEQIIASKFAIANSQTLEEVARLEKALKLGHLPSDIVLAGDDASKISSTVTSTFTFIIPTTFVTTVTTVAPVPPSSEYSGEGTAMEEVLRWRYQFR